MGWTLVGEYTVHREQGGGEGRKCNVQTKTIQAEGPEMPLQKTSQLTTHVIYTMKIP